MEEKEKSESTPALLTSTSDTSDSDIREPNNASKCANCTNFARKPRDLTRILLVIVTLVILMLGVVVWTMVMYRWEISRLEETSLRQMGALEGKVERLEEDCRSRVERLREYVDVLHSQVAYGMG